MALVDLDSPPAWWSQAARNQHGTGWKVYVGLPLSTARFDVGLQDVVGNWEFPKTGVPYYGDLIIRILLFRVLYWGPLFSETPN